MLGGVWRWVFVFFALFGTGERQGEMREERACTDYFLGWFGV